MSKADDLHADIVCNASLLACGDADKVDRQKTLDKIAKAASNLASMTQERWLGPVELRHVPAGCIVKDDMIRGVRTSTYAGALVEVVWLSTGHVSREPATMQVMWREA